MNVGHILNQFLSNFAPILTNFGPKTRPFLNTYTGKNLFQKPILLDFEPIFGLIRSVSFLKQKNMKRNARRKVGFSLLTVLYPSNHSFLINFLQSIAERRSPEKLRARAPFGKT